MTTETPGGLSEQVLGVDPSPDSNVGHMGGGTTGVFSSFLYNVSYISNTNMSLLAGTGYAADKTLTLIPVIELEIGAPRRDPDQEVAPPFVAFIHLDNAAFLVQDFAGDLTTACTSLLSISSGKVKPNTARLERALEFIGGAEEHIRACREALEALVNAVQPRPKRRKKKAAL